MQTNIPQVWKATLDEQVVKAWAQWLLRVAVHLAFCVMTRLARCLQVCREDRQGFLLDLIESEVLPRLPEDRRVTFLHIGANS